jgi:O-antigen/teichoic acid export membrane protein
MSKKAKRNFLRWLIIEVATLVIATIHFIITPNHHSYAVPAYIIISIGAAALVICWLVYKRRLRNKQS